MKRTGRIIIFGFKKKPIILYYKIFKLTLYKLGLIPSSLGSSENSNNKTAWRNCNKCYPQKDWENFGKMCIL
jgi:hypothetical protein